MSTREAHGPAHRVRAPGSPIPRSSNGRNTGSFDVRVRYELLARPPRFVTGHTGFKGAWLVLWLRRLGARVTGLSLPPHTDPGLFALCVRGRATDTYGDIAEYGLVARTLADCEPEIVIHMAAQALVRLSYADPLGTCATNIMGTATFCRRASFLTLDATHARALLGWRPVLSFDDAVNWTADWYRGFWNGDDIGAVTRRQIDAFSERLHHLADDPVPLRGTA